VANTEQQRRFPPSWSIDDSDMKLGQECYVVRDASGYSLRQVPDFAMRFNVTQWIVRKDFLTIPTGLLTRQMPIQQGSRQ
jgi:hypothetical protein